MATGGLTAPNLKCTRFETRLTLDRRAQYNSFSAGVAQLVEHLLPKQSVTGSSPVTRSASTALHGAVLL